VEVGRELVSTGRRGFDSISGLDSVPGSIQLFDATGPDGLPRPISGVRCRYTSLIRIAALLADDAAARHSVVFPIGRIVPSERNCQVCAIVLLHV